MAAVLLLALAAPGCKRSFTPTLAPGDLRASCDKRTILSQCSDYSAASLAQDEKRLRGTCGVLRATYAQSVCPGEARVGSCEIAGAEVRRFYKDGPNGYDRDRARRECELAQGGWFEP